MKDLLNLIELECNLARIATAKCASNGHALKRLYARQKALRMELMKGNDQ